MPDDSKRRIRERVARRVFPLGPLAWTEPYLSPTSCAAGVKRQRAWFKYFWTLEPEPDLCIHLRPNADEISDARIERILKHMCNVIDRDCLGPRWSKKLDKTLAFAFFEGQGFGRHVHVLVRLPAQCKQLSWRTRKASHVENLLHEKLRRRKIAPGCTLRVDYIKDHFDQVRYVLKDQAKTHATFWVRGPRRSKR